MFGQAAFGLDVTRAVAEAGHEIVAVYAPPEGARPDPLAEEAKQRGWPLFRHRRFRKKGEAIPELVEAYRALGAELNLMPFTTVILPPEIVEAPVHGSLCFHPSLLPAYRGGAALAWQIILGAQQTGVSVFRPDEGVDTGPIVVQKAGIEIAPTDTAGSLYFEKLYPLGVEAMREAVEAVAAGTARFQPQDEAGASFQGLCDDAAARIDWTLPAARLDRLLRGCDPSPGAWAEWKGQPVRLFDGRLDSQGAPGAPAGRLLGLEGGRLQIAASDGVVSVGRARLGEGKKVDVAEAGLPKGAQLE